MDRDDHVTRLEWAAGDEVVHLGLRAGEVEEEAGRSLFMDTITMQDVEDRLRHLDLSGPSLSRTVSHSLKHTLAPTPSPLSPSLSLARTIYCGLVRGRKRESLFRGRKRDSLSHY